MLQFKEKTVPNYLCTVISMDDLFLALLHYYRQVLSESELKINSCHSN